MRCSSTTNKQKKPLKKRKICWAVREGDGTTTLPIWKPPRRIKIDMITRTCRCAFYCGEMHNEIDLFTCRSKSKRNQTRIYGELLFVAVLVSLVRLSKCIFLK
jgi:hypothetical protein